MGPNSFDMTNKYIWPGSKQAPTISNYGTSSTQHNAEVQNGWISDGIIPMRGHGNGQDLRAEQGEGELGTWGVMQSERIYWRKN